MDGDRARKYVHTGGLPLYYSPFDVFEGVDKAWASKPENFERVVAKALEDEFDTYDLCKECGAFGLKVESSHENHQLYERDVGRWGQWCVEAARRFRDPFVIMFTKGWPVVHHAIAAMRNVVMTGDQAALKAWQKKAPFVFMLRRGLLQLPRYVGCAYTAVQLGVDAPGTVYQPGARFRLPYPTSSSRKFETVADSLRQVGKGNSIVFIMWVEGGRDVSSCSVSPKEMEVVLLPHSVFEVVGVVEGEDKAAVFGDCFEDSTIIEVMQVNEALEGGKPVPTSRWQYEEGQSDTWVDFPPVDSELIDGHYANYVRDDENTVFFQTTRMSTDRYTVYLFNFKDMTVLSPVAGLQRRIRRQEKSAAPRGSIDTGRRGRQSLTDQVPQPGSVTPFVVTL
eukprot:Hpha_TRINITY_DN17232_c0_g1::TRINITY_DN17232_c0_g1_i1::g.17772::m.17772